MVTTHQHTVQFYEDDTFLCERVARYLAAGIAKDQPLVLIATGPHRERIAHNLTMLGCNVTEAQHHDRIAWLDAHEVLSSFMVGLRPDADLFRQHVGGVLERLGRRRPGLPVCAYGEMVDVLWNEGNSDGALRLEELWNDLATTHHMTLLCGYAMAHFRKESQWPQFEAVCGQHSHVIPTEQYSRIADDELRLREISLLQQRARALQTEIEQRKELEQALRHALADRERAQAERERLLAAEHAARADAQAASRLKDEFLAVLSHELRTPLNAILGWAQIAAGRQMDDLTVKRALEIIQRNANIQLHVVNDLLDVSRIVTGKMVVTIARIDLGDVLATAVDTVRPAAVAKSIDLSLIVDDEARLCTGDATRLQQVLWNILSNAVKFTPPDGRIDVRLDRAGANARVTVSDSGCGIAPKFLPHVFDRFRQEDAGMTRKHGGLGLGLSVVRYLVEAHGGTVSAASAGEGLGATFTILLPLRPATGDEADLRGMCEPQRSQSSKQVA